MLLLQKKHIVNSGKHDCPNSNQILEEPIIPIRLGWDMSHSNKNKQMQLYHYFNHQLTNSSVEADPRMMTYRFDHLR